MDQIDESVLRVKPKMEIKNMKDYMSMGSWMECGHIITLMAQ